MTVFTLNFLPHKPIGPVSSNIYRPEFENYINDHKIIQTTKTQNMMMYQILCGHVNYALGKTRMQVKKKKDTLFWIHVYINLLKILKSSSVYSISSLSISSSSSSSQPILL